MRIVEFASAIDAVALTGEGKNDMEVTGIYACDLLSWVMSHAERGDAWITVHTHVNIVAVAILTGISCIVVPEGSRVEEATIKRAEMEGVVILSTVLDTYEICRRVPGL